MKPSSPQPVLLIASRNAHKVGEIRAILGESFRYATLDDLPDAPTVVEDATTFAGNAAKKATELARWLSAAQLSTLSSQLCFVLADDSGLEVDPLDGAPGVHSARFAALEAGRPGNSSDTDNNARLLRLLKDVAAEKRTARFHCVIALVEVKPESGPSAPEFFDGVCEGKIRFAPQGQGGFGYDPLFVPDGFEQSFAELGEEVKNRLSHRAKALFKLRRRFERAA